MHTHLGRMSLLFLILSLLTSAYLPQQLTPWQAKVDPWVLEQATAGATEFLVKLSAQADLSRAVALPGKVEKGTYVTQKLRQTASHTQAPLLAHLRSLGLPYRSYWVVNLVWVRGEIGAVRSLAARADVVHIYANPRVRLDLPVQQAASAFVTEGIEWNLDWVNAPGVWGLGYTGQGVVVGGADTGYDWDHPALINQYRGWDGEQVDHNYNWFDATAQASPVPIDPYGHGTHTMGIIVGDDGAENQIGMASGARWVGCRNMDSSGYGTPETYIACYQWFIAPTDVQGASPDPTRAPDVINNSWGCPLSEGCIDPEVLLEAVQAVRAAGILTTHSAGNDGAAGCETIDIPAAMYAESFTVGATGYLTETLASYSSRGPVTVDGSGRLKPNVVAPGSAVRSCIPGTGYVIMSGTSMAAPHVAGLAALLISAQPALRGQVDQIEALIESTALATPSTECSSEGVPNNLYGWGRIDALAAVLDVPHALELDKHASPAVFTPGQTITYTLSLTHQHVISPTLGVVLTDTLPAGTTFISANQPYTQTGDVVRWEFASLAAGETVRVELVVLVAEDWDYWIVNEHYAAWSMQVSEPVEGLPVYTPIRAIYTYTFPLMIKNPDRLIP